MTDFQFGALVSHVTSGGLGVVVQAARYGAAIVWWEAEGGTRTVAVADLVPTTPTAYPHCSGRSLQRRIERARDGHLAAMEAADAAQRSNVRDMHCAVALAMGLLLADDMRGAE